MLDANTGQNALAQVKAFDAAVGLTGLIVTKLDGSAKGGVVAAIAKQHPVPLRFIGVGEALDDLRPFVAREFVDALLPAEPDAGGHPSLVSARSRRWPIRRLALGGDPAGRAQHRSRWRDRRSARRSGPAAPASPCRDSSQTRCPRAGTLLACWFASAAIDGDSGLPDAA